MKPPKVGLYLTAVAIAILNIPYSRAQTAAGPSIAPIPTNIPSVREFVAPPAMFSPVAASPEELQQYGFPPMPDKVNAPSAYNSWAKAVTAPQTRLQSLRLEQTTIFNRLDQIKSSTESNQLANEIASAPTNTIATSSSNWSGYVDYNNTTKPFAKSYIYAYWIVPVAQHAFGNTTAGWDDSSQWVGIDGYGSTDLLQAGTEADAYQSGSTKSTLYAAWFEWVPLTETRISGFAVAPGDVMYVEVWNTSSTVGNAYLLNLTTQKSYSVTFDAPSGTKLVGNSAEWIVERPEINGVFSTLTNYVACPFASCYAYGSVNGGTYNSLYYPGVNAVDTTAYDVSMLDNNGRVISVGTLNGPAQGTTLTGIWFRDTGSAF